MLLKEDGHLDCERVYNLGRKELNEEMKSWGYEQSEEFRLYLENLPISESNVCDINDGPIVFDGTLEEFIKRFC